MTQLDDFQNPLIFSNSPFAQQVVNIMEDSVTTSEQKDKLDTFQIFQKILGIWVHKTSDEDILGSQLRYEESETCI